MKRSEIKRTPLADTVLATLEPETKEYRVHDGAGLYFRVKPNGNKSWQLRYRKPDGKWSFMGVGPYGTGAHQLTGAQARKKAAELLANACDEQSPLMARRQQDALQAKAEKNTLENLIAEWLASKASGWSDGTLRRNTAVLNKHVNSVFGKRLFADITPMEWMELLRNLEQQGIVEQTKRIRSLCRDAYDLARVTGRIQHNPLEGLHKYLQARNATNYTFVPLDEFPALLRAIRSYPHAPDVCIGLQLLSLLFCRPGELRNATWEEFDLEAALWTIPAERMKRRYRHFVPLSTQAVKLLHELQEYTGQHPLLFVGRNDTSKPKSDTVFLMALRRLGYQGRQTGHGFRHLASTILNEHGFNSDHIEAQLSHSKEKIRGTYDKAEHLQARREMMQWYADHLDTLAAGNVAQPCKEG